jgi:4-alpha-glucanotransferase
MHFWLWIQYEFMRQWQSVLSYAHKNGITVIGDMPIYVAHDSVDVWRSPDEFLLDENFAPTIVAGCPPDAYSEDGQLWGNPIYNWEKMQKDGFDWWCRRVGAAFCLYDVLRIDHFRGFASFYAIPYGDENARRGEWREAPGAELFDKIKSVYPDAPIIAEDLGFITDDVRELLRYTGFPGMKLLQFAFFDEDSEYLPRTYTSKNCIAYPASHDSDCTRSWYASLDAPTRARFRRETSGLISSSAAYRLIELSHSSIAKLSVIPMQDYLELGGEARMNCPGTLGTNWKWRAAPGFASDELAAYIRLLTERYGRL